MYMKQWSRMKDQNTTLSGTETGEDMFTVAHLQTVRISLNPILEMAPKSRQIAEYPYPSLKHPSTID